MPSDPLAPQPGEVIYRWLLRAYPSEFRDAFGDMMVDFYRERIARDARPRGRGALLATIAKAYGAAVLGGLRERIAPLGNRHLRRYPPHGSRMLTNSRHDLGYALRTLRRTPLFTIAVLATLAIGIGANVAIFSVVNGVLLHPLPFADADRVIQLSNHDSPSTLSEPEVVDVARDARSFSGSGAYAYSDGNITGGDASIDAERVRIARVNGGFFPTLRPPMFIGRGLTPDDDRAGAADVVVISHGLWQRRFGMDPSVLGRKITVNDAPRTIVGVLPPRFEFPSADVAVWTPLRLDRDAMVTRNNHYLRVVARLAPRITMTAADEEMRRLRDAWARDYPDAYKKSDPLQVDVKPIRDRIVGAARPYLVALLGAVGFVLLIACVNVANLLVARAETRRTDQLIRAALGGTRLRIASQRAIESGVLAIGGGILGVLLAWPLLRALVAWAPASIPRVGEITLDARALAFAAGACVLTGLCFSLAPLATSAGSLAELNSGSRNPSHSGGRAAARARSALVVSEIALAVLMLAGALMFVRTLIDLQRTELGFATDGVVTAQITLPRPAYNGERGARFVADLVERVRQMPGVSNAAAMAWIPIAASGGNWSIAVEGRPKDSMGEAPLAAPQQITPGYFATMSIPLRRGREFTTADRAESEGVVIVNETLAQRLWRTTDVVGKRLRMAGNDSTPWMTVVGVAADTRVDGITEAAPPIMYFPHAQARITAYFTSLSMGLLVRTTNTDALVPSIRRTVRDMDAKVPVSEVRTMHEVVAASLARHRFTTLLLGGLAGFAMLLAAIGIYGVMAYTVAQRRYELGVRIALGAHRGQVLGLVVRHGLGLTLIGLTIGLTGAFVLGQTLRAMLAGIGVVDAPVLAAVAMLLLLVSLVALIVPARSALSIDPTEALRPR